MLLAGLSRWAALFCAVLYIVERFSERFSGRWNRLPVLARAVVAWTLASVGWEVVAHLW